MSTMRNLIAGVCCFTIAASCWLATMSFVLHHAGYQRQAGLALLFVAQSLLTLAVLAGRLSAVWARIVMALGAAGLVVVGGRVMAANLSGPHFEGYAVIIGASLIVQGVLTLGAVCVRWPRSLSNNAPIW